MGVANNNIFLKDTIAPANGGTLNNSIPVQKDVAIDTPPPSVKPTKTTATTTTTNTTTTSSSTGKKSSFVYSSPNINFEDGNCLVFTCYLDWALADLVVL